MRIRGWMIWGYICGCICICQWIVICYFCSSHLPHIIKTKIVWCSVPIVAVRSVLVVIFSSVDVVIQCYQKNIVYIIYINHANNGRIVLPRGWPPKCVCFPFETNILKQKIKIKWGEIGNTWWWKPTVAHPAIFCRCRCSMSYWYPINRNRVIAIKMICRHRDELIVRTQVQKPMAQQQSVYFLVTVFSN